MSDFTLVIGTKRYSTWSLRPWLVLREAGADFEEIEIALRQPDTKARILEQSPSGKVPLLKHGEVMVWDSLAICDYLSEHFPGLWPADSAARAMARAVSAEMHSGFQALRQAMPMDFRASIPMTDIAPEVQADIDRITALWTECRTRFGAEGPFLFGKFSIADAMLAPVVSRFTTYDVPVDTTCAAYMAAVWSLDGMGEWLEACA